MEKLNSKCGAALGTLGVRCFHTLKEGHLKGAFQNTNLLW